MGEEENFPEKTWGENREVGKEILNLAGDFEGEAGGENFPGAILKRKCGEDSPENGDFEAKSGEKFLGDILRKIEGENLRDETWGKE